MKYRSFTHFLRSLTAFALALMLPFNALAGTLTLPAAIKVVEEQAFMDNTSVDKVVLPEGATTIKSQAFKGATSLERVVIPSTVENIADDAFEGVESNIIIETSKGSPAWDWAEAKGIRVEDPNAPAGNVTVERGYTKVYMDGNRDSAITARVYVQNETVTAMNAEYVSGNEGVRLYFDEVKEVDGKQRALLYADSITAPGEAVWKITVTTESGSYSEEIAVTVVEEGHVPTAVVPKGDDVFYGKIGEKFTFFPSEHFTTDIPADECAFGYATGENLWDEESFEYLDEGFSFMPTRNGTTSLTIRYYQGNHMLTYDATIVIGELANVTMEQYVHTLYVNGNLDEMDVANFICEDEAITDWNVEYVSGNEDISLYFDHTEDGKQGWIIAENIVSAGESVWKVTLTTESGATWTDEITVNVRDDVELPTELLPIDGGDGILYGNVGEQFVFTGSELFQADVPMAEAIYGYSIYYEIYYHETYATHQDGIAGSGFSFTPDKNGRYGVWVRYFAGNHMQEYEAVIIIGDGSSTEAVMITENLSPVIYLTDMSENDHVWLGNMWLDRFPLLPGEEVEWTVELVESSNEEPVIGLDVSGVFPDTYGTNVTATGFSGETGTATYRITAKLGNTVVSHDYEIEVKAAPAGLPTALDVPATHYEVEVGDELTFMLEDVTFADGEVPDGMNVYTDFWGTDRLDEDQEYIWLEGGMSYRFVKEGRYAFDAVKVVGGVTIMQTITIVVGDGISDDVEFNWFTKMPVVYIDLEDDMINNHVGWFDVDNYDLLEDEWVKWDIEQIEGDELLKLRLEENADELNYWLYVDEILGGTGMTKYRVTVTTEGGLEFSAEFSIDVQNAPEGLPTEIIVDETDFYFEIGDTHEFLFDELELGEGYVPEGIQLRKEIWNVDQIPGAEYIESEDPEGAGVRVTFEENGRYAITFAIKIGNYMVTLPGTITVGNGMDEDAELVFDHFNEHHFPPAEDWMVNWAGDVYLENYELMHGETLEWSMQRLDESSLTPAEFIFDPFWDENRGVGLRLTNFTGEAGDMTYRITLTSSLGQSWSEDVTFHIYEQPENMPTAIAMPVMVFEIEKGETIYINRDDIHFVDGVVPEDAVVFKDIWINDVEDHSDFEWTREGFKATFHENGRFSFFTAVYLNGVEYVCQVKVLVGTGVSDDAGLYLSWLNPVQYPQDEQAWLGDLWLENYNVYGDEEIAWDAECIEGDESIVRVDLDVIEVDGQPFLAGLRLNDFSGETGTVTWRVTVSTNYGNSWSEDITFEVVEKPEDLPTTLNGFETRIELNVGDTLRLYVDDIEFADGVVPEDAVIHTEYYIHNIDFLPGFEYRDDGFKVTFEDDGRYEVYAVAHLNGMEYVVPIQVIVGTGISSEARIRFHQNAYTAYATEDREHNAWIGCVALEEYQIFDGEEIEWTIERIDENENTPLKAYVDNVWGDQYGANIHVTDFSGETGSMEYRIHMKSSSGYSTSVDFTLDVVEQPDNLPTILHVPSDNVQLNVGDTYELYEHDFTFGDGELPEGAALHYEFGDIEGTFHDQPFWWHENDDGFGVRFVREGRYEFTAYVLINTYRVSRTVRITVGDGMADNVHIGWFQPLEVAYTGIEGEVFALQAEVVDYQLFEGESYNWKIDYIGEGEEPLTVYINRDYDDGRGVILHAKDVQHTGLAAYRLSVTSEGGLNQAIEFTIDVQECPEDLPTQLGADCTDFHLDVGDTFTFRDTDVYFADGTVPENVMLVTEYWCIEQIENMESFQSLETHGGFQVTFEDEGVYAFEVAKKIGNHVLTLPVRVIVGNGMEDFLFVDWKINPVFNDFGEDQNTFVTALQTKYFTSENELLQRENIEFTIDILNDDGNLPAELYLNDYHEPTWVDVHARNFTGGTGTIEYRVNAKLENGEVYSYESSVDIVDFPDNLPTEVIVEQEEYHLNPGDTFEYDLSTVSCAGGEIPEGAMHYAEAWTDGLERMDSFRWTDEGFRVTFYENDRFSFRVAYRINSYTIEKQIRIYVGTGHRDDTYVDWLQEIHTIYKDVEDESTWIGWGVLDNFNSFGDESATWTLGRIDESENDPVELFIEVFGGKHADLRFRNVESTGSVTYRLSVETDSGYLDSHDFTLNVEELPDNLPTELDMQTYYEYQVGDMFEFDSTQIGFANGVVPENASLRTHLRGIEELQNMESFEWTDTGFRVAFDYEGTFVFTVGRQIGNYTLTQDVRVKVGKGWNDDAHVDWGMTERTIYTNVDDWIWAFNAFLIDYPFLENEELYWNLEWVDGVDFIEIERDEEFGEWNGVNFNFAPTHDRTGTAVYRLSLHTDDGFEASQEYTVTVVERPDDLPTEINVGETEYHLNIGDTFTFTDEMVSFANGTVPEGAWTNVNFGYLEWGIDSIESFHWLDDVNGFEVTFDQNGRYMFSAMAWINNYLVTKHIHIYVGNGEDEDAYLNWFTKMPVAYIGLEEGMASDHIGWFVLENYHLFEDEQIHWNVEQIEGEHLLDLRLEEFDGAYNHWLYVDGFRGGTGMTKYRVTVTTDGGFESSAEFSIDVQNAPENLPVELVVDTVDWEFNVGDTHEFLFADIGYGEGDVPEGALVRREIWGLAEQISGAELIRESDDPEGDGYSVTFDSVGSYDITYVIKINNYMLMMPGSITVTAPVSEETHVDWGMTERTIYTNVDDWIWAFGAHLNNYPQCDGDELHWDLEWVDGVDFIDIERDWEYNEWNGVFYNFASTHDRTGTAVYRLNLHTNGGFSASQDYTVTVMERPDDLPTDINVGETEYHLNIGDTFTFTDEMISFADGNVPEDAWTHVNFGYLEWGIDSVESFHWLDDAHGFEVTFDQNGRYMFSAMVWINNYLLTKHIYIDVGTGIPDNAWVEYWGEERTVYTNSSEQAWGFYAELHDYSLLPEERLEWTLEQVSEGEAVAFVERNFDAGHRELGCRYDVLPTGEATGTVVYRLTLTTDSGFTSSKDITIHVEDRPDDLPTELNVGPTEYNLRVGETFTFTADMISFANGNVPEGAYTEINFGYLEHGINEQESFRWLEHTHGFEVSFQDKGRYMFSAMSWVNNHLVTKHIFLNVETNANEEAELVWFTKMPVAYVGLEEGHISDHVGWFYVDRYELPEGERVHWEVEQIEGEELLYLRLEEFDDPLSYWLYVDGVSGGTGMTKYRVTVTTEGGLERSAEFSIDVQNAPEGLPTEVIVGQTDWHFEIGDYYEFRFDSVGYGDGYVPEDALVRREIWNVENIPGAEQIFESDDPEGDGYRVTFDRSGRYDITYAIKINNYMIMLPGTVTVGTGVSSETGLVFGALNRQHYPPVDEHRVNWAGDIYLENYELEEGETLEWHVERIDENETTPAEFFLDPFWDENRGAGMRLRNFTGEAGSMTYRITLESNMERSWSEEITFVIHEQPENLPTGITLPENIIHINEHETLFFNRDEIEFVDGEVLDGAYVYKEFWIGELEERTDFRWTDEGFAATFHESGRYAFDIVAYLNGVEYNETIWVVVGSGVREEAHIQFHQHAYTAYATEDEHNAWIGCVALYEYEILPDEEIEWSIERVDGRYYNPLNAYVDNVWEDQYGANIHVTDFTGESGLMKYRLHMNSSYGFHTSCDFKLDVVDLPENMPTELEGPADEVHVEVGDVYDLYPEDFIFADGVVPENANFHYEFDNVEWTFRDQDFWWHENDGCFSVKFGQEGRYEFTASVLINTYRLSRTVRITVGDGVRDDVYLNLWHSQDPVYTGLDWGGRSWVGNAYVENYQLFTDETIEWSVAKKNADEETVAVIELSDTWDNGLGQNYEVADITATGETSYVISAVLPTGETLTNELTQHVIELPEGLPTELVVPQDSYVLHVGEEFTLMLSDIQFGEGNLPENAAYHTDIFPDEELSNLGIWNWFETEDGADGGVSLVFDEPGFYNLYARKWIGNYMLDQTITLYVVDSESDWKIALLVGSENQGEEVYTAARKVQNTYGEDRVIVETYPDNFAEEYETMQNQVLSFAEDPDVKAIIISQGVAGTADLFMMVNEMRPDMLLMTTTPQDEFDYITGMADVVMMSDEVQQAYPIMETCEAWGVDVFVHYSFDRHLAGEAVAGRRAILMQKAAELGIEFVDVSIPDPLEQGLNAACDFISMSVDEKARLYADRKVAFFSTNCGVQGTLQSAVLRNENAYYPSPCCPSPYHGFGESMGLNLDMSGNPNSALRKIAGVLAEHNALGRFSTWAAPVNMGMVEAAAKYAVAFAQSSLQSVNDSGMLRRILSAKYGDVVISNDQYDNLYTIQLDPVNFSDYTTLTKIAILTGSEAQSSEEYMAAMNAMEIYGADRVIVEQYADNFAEDPQATAEQILELAMDHDVSAIIVAQSVPGTLEGFEMARDNREDILLVSVVPMEDFGDMSNAADILLYSDEPAQAETIMRKCEEWGIDVLVHYSFDRHMQIGSIWARRNAMYARAEELGIEFLDVKIPDPVSSTGLEGARSFIEENLPEVMAEYEGQKVAFFSTNCGVQATLQSAVLEHDLAYYPQPCCPSPYHGFGEALGVADELDYGRPADALRTVAEALFERNAADRFSTWAAPVNMGMVDVAAEYAMLYADEKISDRNDGELLNELFNEHFSGATIHTEFHNGYSILLAPIDFMDYVINAENVIQLWVADDVKDFTTEQVQAFKTANAEYADMRVHIRSVGEGDAADTMLKDVENGADMYVFAQDQLARLVSGGALNELSQSNAATVTAQNTADSVDAVTLGDTLYAYPMTADNGYFLYYDRSLIGDPSNLDEILALCEEENRTFHMEITSGWYQPAFFFGAGCTLNYETNNNGDFIDCNVDYASANGLKALKSMIRVVNSSAFRDATDADSISSMGALVSGTWMAQAVQETLGSNYAAVKLPYVDGYQMGGFSGYKMLGVKPQENEAKLAACEALAMYLTSENVQLDRFEAAGWGPSNSNAQASEAVQADEALAALTQQLPYTVPQGQYPDEYWNLASDLGARAIRGEFNNLSDEELMEVLAAFEDAVSALASEPETYTLLRARASNSVFEGWGTSLCWWANRIGYSDTLSQQAADLFYSEDGLDFNIMRYNIGGGDDPTHRHITRTDSAVPGWMKWDEAQQQFVYDYEADHNQLNVLLRAVNAAGENAMVEAFSNSPPYFMTVSGCSSGGEDPSVDNLRDDCYEDFAEYLAHVTDYLQRELSVPVVSLSPMNEPNTSYWRYLSDKQEGCHFDAGASQSKILEATAEAMQRYELTNVLLAASDETSPEKQLEAWYAYSDQARNAIGRINTHTYGEEQIETLGQLVKDENLHLWMSEVDGGETAGENAGEMGAALWLGQKIISDLNALSPSAWVMWQAIDNHISQDGYNGNQDYGMVDVNQGYWGIAVADHDNKEIILTQKYYGMGQFTRYIRPGSTLIHCGPELIAAYDGHSGQLSIVTVNVSKQVKDICLDVSEFVQDTSVRVIRTSGGTEDGEQWAELVPAAVEDGLLNVSLKEHSITTFVLSI